MLLLLCCYSTFFCCSEVIIWAQATGLLILQRQQRGSSNGEGRKRQVWGLDLNIGKTGLPQPSVFLQLKWEGWAGLHEFFGPFSAYHSRSPRSTGLKFILNQSSVATREKGSTFLWLVPKRLSLRPWRCWTLRQGLCWFLPSLPPPKLRPDSVKRTETRTSARGTEHVGFSWLDCLPSL